MKNVFYKPGFIVLFITVAVEGVMVDYSGSITGSEGEPVGMARVALEGTSLCSYSDANGAFRLQGEIDGVNTVAGSEKKTFSVVFLSGLMFNIRSIGPETQFTVELFNANGQKVFYCQVKNRTEVSVDLNTVIKSGGFYILRVVNHRVRCLYTVVCGGKGTCVLLQERRALQLTAGVATAAQRKNVIDVEAPGYYPESFLQNGTEAAGLKLVVDKQNSDTLDTFQRFFTGNGNVKNIKTGEMIAVPEQRRIHVILFPEGYTKDEYDETKYVRDCLSWYRSVFAFAPMLFFRECFVIWRFPVLSNEHVNRNGVADTWFRLQLSGGGMTTELGVASEKIWNLMDEFPYPPEHFYSGWGLTGGRAKNLIAQMLVFDPSSDKAWFSGLATAIQNPQDQQQMIGIAMAQDQQHEFMHVLAHFLDEYYELDHSPLQSALDGSSSGYLTNVAPTNDCDELPWKHLIYGGEYNPGVDSLVGAFGANGRYHSELYCLMNGSHDNKTLFGGDGQLRVYDRLCNFCRELAAFRIYERLGVLENDQTSWLDWIAEYRVSFYEEFHFLVPEKVPQENSDKQLQWFPCGN